MARQWSPDDVLRLASSYQQACVLAAAADLDLFTMLRGRNLAVQTIAKELHADARGTRVLLDALAAMELLTKKGSRYSVPADVAEILSEGGELSKLAMVQHQANCMRRWVQLANVVKTGRPAERVPSIRGQDADQAAFIEAMDNISAPMAGPLVATLQPLQFTHLLDIGGASGTWTIALLRAVPRATATIFDLPHVIPFARARLAGAGLADRVTFVEGDFYTDDLPAGADFAWVSAIIHQNDSEQNRDLYRKVYAALVPGGQIAIRDIVMDETHTKPTGGALFAINMLTGTQKGGTYSLEEIKADLEACGFTDVTLWRRGEWMDSVVRATKPKTS